MLRWTLFSQFLYSISTFTEFCNINNLIFNSIWPCDVTGKNIFTLFLIHWWRERYKILHDSSGLADKRLLIFYWSSMTDLFFQSKWMNVGCSLHKLVGLVNQSCLWEYFIFYCRQLFWHKYIFDNFTDAWSLGDFDHYVILKLYKTNIYIVPKYIYELQKLSSLGLILTSKMLLLEYFFGTTPGRPEEMRNDCFVNP